MELIIAFWISGWIINILLIIPYYKEFNELPSYSPLALCPYMVVFIWILYFIWEGTEKFIDWLKNSENQ